MQEGLPSQAARQAARSSTTGSAIGAGDPAGTSLTGAACVCLRARPPVFEAVGTTDGMELHPISYATRLVDGGREDAGTE